MIYFKQNLGIDVDSKKLVTSFQKVDVEQNIKIIASRSFDNTATGFELMSSWLEKKKIKNLPIHVTMEATGVYYENVAYFLHEQENIIVHVVLPNMSNAYMKSLNSKSKTDKIDAANLAKMGLERKLLKWNPGSDQMRSIKKLVRERFRLQKEKTMICNQLHAENKSHVSKNSIVQRYEMRIGFIEEQLAEVEAEIKAEVNLDSELKSKIDKVCTAPGIGFITAIGVVAETDAFTLFRNRKQLTSYAGYDVTLNESGSTIHSKAKISKKGNSYIRQILFMPAMSAARFNEDYTKLYNRIFFNSKIKMKGNVAIQRKLLLLIYTLFKNNTEFDPLYKQKVDEQLAKQRNQKKNMDQQKRIKDLSDRLNKTADRVQATACPG